MRPSEEDLLLIGGDFLTAQLPSEKAWLHRYFISELLRRFVVYYVTFRELTRNLISLRHFCQSFIDHTGYFCSIALLCRTAKKLRLLEEAAAQAEKTRDLTTLTNLKLGKYKIK